MLNGAHFGCYSGLNSLRLHSKITDKEWLVCLSAADRWDSPSLRTLSLSALEQSSAVARVVAARRYGKPEWLDSAITTMVKNQYLSSMREHLKLLDIDDLILFMEVREATKAYLNRTDLHFHVIEAIRERS
jgi:DNA-binding GntR family transcriptional regulator